MARRRLVFLGLLSALLLLPAGVLAGSTVPVAGDGEGGWSVEETPAASVSFEEIDQAPLGNGAVRLHTQDGSGRATLRNAKYAWVPIRYFSSLTYWTNVVDGGPTGVVAPAIKLPVLFNDGNDFTTLVFEPTYTGEISIETWQRWDALEGRWWSTRDLPGIPSPANNCVSFDDCFVSWSEILEAIPDARTFPASFGGGLLLETGSGTQGADGYADALTVGVGPSVATYDFEPSR